MKVELGKIYRRADGRLVRVHEILIQECLGEVVGNINDGMVPVQVTIAIGRSPDLNGRMYFFAETGKRVGTNGASSDLVDLDDEGDIDPDDSIEHPSRF